MTWNKRSRLDAAWDNGKTATNAWQFGADPHVSETLAHGGFDVVTIDMQHGVMTRVDVLGMVRAIEGGGATPFVRLPSMDPNLVGWLLDAGVVGLICPTINSPLEAREFVSAATYHPGGTRSHGPVRAQQSIDSDYMQTYLDNIELFAMVETSIGLEQVEGIAKVTGLSGVFIGPGDLGITMGLGPGQNRTEPEITNAIIRVQRAAEEAQCRLGIHATDPRYAADMADQGFDLVTVTSDHGALNRQINADLEQFRAPATTLRPTDLEESFV